MNSTRFGRVDRHVGPWLLGLAIASCAPAALAATAQPNANCQAGRYNVVSALPVHSSPLSYTGTIGELLTSTASDPDPNVHAFSQAYYGIPGAAAYYYVLHRDFRNSDDRRYWVAISIIDEQEDVSSPVEYYGGPLSLANVRFPAYTSNAVTTLYGAAQGSAQWPESGGVPLGHWVTEIFLPQTGTAFVYPFQLRASDYGALQTVMSSTYADSTVDPQDLDCVLIVDPNGVPIDFAAHITEWDPKPACPSCN